MADDRISRLLKDVLVYRNPGSIERVADYMGETYDHIWSQTHGRVNPKIQVVKAAYVITGDQRLKRELEPEGHELVPAREAEAIRDAESESTDIVIHASRLIERLRGAVHDGAITEVEAEGLEKSFCDLEKELIEARSAVRRLAENKRFKAVK